MDWRLKTYFSCTFFFFLYFDNDYKKIQERNGRRLANYLCYAVELANLIIDFDSKIVEMHILIVCEKLFSKCNNLV